MFTIITGAQFGDEGKGKLVDMLAQEYDIVVRFQGGDNAGHTVVAEGKTYKLHNVPSGVLFDARLLIGPGTVMNPKILLEEIEMLAENGVDVTPQKLGIDAKTSIIMPYHMALDTLREGKRTVKIGTTSRGIGFAYMDKVGRDEVQMADIADSGRFKKRMYEIVPQKKSAIKEMNGDPAIVTSGLDDYLEIGKRLKPYITDVSREVNLALNAGKKVLAEGAQGSHLDVIHGTQKFVTSSSTVAGSACAGLGVGPTKVDNVMGIIKAYITRVGEGPLPTELKNKDGEHLREKGMEFGTTTGRPRRCGWFDLPLAKKSINLNGYTTFALTKLDVLTGLSPLRICTGYELNGKTLDYPPELSDELAGCKPVYKEVPGWGEDITGTTGFGDMPGNAQKYVLLLEEMMGVTIEYVSVGPGRKQTFKK
ncbi:MAG: adenylosuccinate synthase [Candidatus Methanoperedens sp.]|jgi:adenylosuccinate synthase|nr:adenylosuccinate synthase [Candidatus Methanoperedens sp.]PKL53621.1 MAG: adenylosuccinate synthase [Candidatus Methanoperedenaceae archaeon HGW-Methanoperedenaceae-1]